MNLVNYSDSETSDLEQAATVKTKPSTKPSFEKVVDRSNPHKIRVQLPKLLDEADNALGSTIGREPPSKRPRTGGGAFSGFNSLLPAPKRHGPIAEGSAPASNGRAKGDGTKRISLKTGIEPAFERRTASELEEQGELVTRLEREDAVRTTDEAPHELLEKPIIRETNATDPSSEGSSQIIKKSTMFKPLSVARKSQTKKIPWVEKPSATAPSDDGRTRLKAPSAAPKASLFPLETLDPPNLTSQTDGDYKPMIYESRLMEGSTTATPFAEVSTQEEKEDDAVILENGAQPTNTPEVGSTLDSIASDLGLSDSAKRRLFGRQKGAGRQVQDLSAVNVINFSTDQEYAANEALRASGEAVQHNPVRAIAPGKHSLQQLVNAASSQKGALEEHFATGRRNKKEAGSRYGW